MPVQITNQYWIVNDTNPTTQVWSGPLGQLVANTDATFEAWLNAADGRAATVNGCNPIATTSHGGLIQVQTDNPHNLSTGQVINFVGNNSGAAGAAAITVIDATHFDIQGSAFSVADTSGTLWSATMIDTAADLYQVIDTYNRSLYFEGQFLGVNQQTTGVSIVLTNPLKGVQIIQPTTSGLTVALPVMSVPGAPPIGALIVFENKFTAPNSFNYQIVAQDGVTVIAVVPSGHVVQICLIDNSTQNGAFANTILTLDTTANAFWNVAHGGTGHQSLTAHGVLLGNGIASIGQTAAMMDGQLLVGQTSADPLPKTLSGDATLSAAGALIVSGTGGTAFGPLATLAAPLAVIYGGTQTTVAPVAGQVLIAQSASLYAPTALVGGATLTAGGTVALGNPAAAQRGGIFSRASVASQFLVSLDTSGSLTGAQPAFSNLMGVASIAQGGTNQTAAPSAGQLLIAQSSSAFAPMTLSGGATLGAGGTVTLGTPGAAQLGGLFSFASVSNQFLVSLATSGSLVAAQPAFSNISGTVAAAQLSTATTQATGDNTAKIATDAFVTTAVNNAISGVNPAVSVAVATTGNLPNTPAYNNGASGIGAFITSGTNSVLVLDGYTPLLNDRVLVKNETGGLGASRNGVYNVTQLGVAGVLPWILTRALDYDQPSDINSTGAIPVVNGTVNATTSWVITSTVNTVGTDALTYTQFTLAPASVLQVANNLSDVASAATSRTNLGLGTMATVNSPVPAANGGTGVSYLPLQGFIGGLGLSNDGVSPNTVIDIAAGMCCSDDQTTMMKLTAFTKTTGAWAVGTGNGGLDTGAVANSTWYHVFVIERPDTGVVDALISTSATAPTMPTNYTKKRRVGSFLTDGSAHIIAFVQDGDVFRWATPIQDYSATNPGTAAVTVTLASVPIGAQVFADLCASMADTNAQFAPIAWYLSDLALPDLAATFPACTVGAGSNGYSAASTYVARSTTSVRVNTSAQIRSRLQVSTASTIVALATLGWTDRRGAR